MKQCHGIVSTRQFSLLGFQKNVQFVHFNGVVERLEILKRRTRDVTSVGGVVLSYSEVSVLFRDELRRQSLRISDGVAHLFAIFLARRHVDVFDWNFLRREYHFDSLLMLFHLIIAKMSFLGNPIVRARLQVAGDGRNVHNQVRHFFLWLCSARALVSEQCANDIPWATLAGRTKRRWH